MNRIPSIFQLLCLLSHLKAFMCFQVEAAVRSQGRALRFACEELRADPKLVLLAARKDAGALSFVAEKVLEDKHFMELLGLKAPIGP